MNPYDHLRYNNMFPSDSFTGRAEPIDQLLDSDTHSVSSEDIESLQEDILLEVEGLDNVHAPLLRFTSSMFSLSSLQSHAHIHIEQPPPPRCNENHSRVTPSDESLSSRVVTPHASAQPITPRPGDVLCGKGGDTIRHNRHFVRLCSEFAPEYSATKKRGPTGKKGIARKIINEIREENGRFLKYCKRGELWEELSEAKAIEKVGHCIRDIVRRSQH